MDPGSSLRYGRDDELGRRADFFRILLSSFLGGAYNLKAIADYETGPDSRVSAELARNAIETARRYVEVIAALLAQLVDALPVYRSQTERKAEALRAGRRRFCETNPISLLDRQHGPKRSGVLGASGSAKGWERPDFDFREMKTWGDQKCGQYFIGILLEKHSHARA